MFKEKLEQAIEISRNLKLSELKKKEMNRQEEIISMLNILKDSAKSFGDETILSGIHLLSFNFVIDEAQKLIERR